MDIFRKSFVFVPIHDALHWSLVVICHPGETAAEDGEPGPTPVMLHLDSLGREWREGPGGGGWLAWHGGWPGGEGLRFGGRTGGPGLPACRLQPASLPAESPAEAARPSLLAPARAAAGGGHNSQQATGLLRHYLTNEWRSKARDASPDSTFLPAREATGGAAPRSFEVMPHARPKVPLQDNHCDCGLFLCAFAEFFSAALPPYVCADALSSLSADYQKTGVDLFEGEEGYYPGGEGGGAALGGFVWLCVLLLSRGWIVGGREAAPLGLRSLEVLGGQGSARAWLAFLDGMRCEEAPTRRRRRRRRRPAAGRLTRHWFEPRNASNLRHEISRLVLTQMALASELAFEMGGEGVDDTPGLMWYDGADWPEEKRAQAAALREALADTVRKQATEGVSGSGSGS